MTVAVFRMDLHEDDVRRLVRGASASDRAAAAEKICRHMAPAALTPAEREAAGEILAFMARDAAILVRKALSRSMANSPNLPRSVARALADDIDAIAAPVIENALSLEDEDLVAILSAGSPAKQLAIAGRARLSAPVVAALVETGDSSAVARAAANDGALFDIKSYRRALERFAEDPAVTDAFIDRSALPIVVAEKLVTLVADAALERLARKHALPPQLAVELAEGARERASIDLLDQAGVCRDLPRFVQQLQLNGRLTPSLILRGLCLGHMAFFEHAAAELTGLSHDRVWLLIHDAGPLGLRAVFERSGLPSRMFAAVRAAVDVYHEMEIGDGADGRERFAQTMIERVLTRHQGMSRDELDYLLDKLDALSDRAAGIEDAAAESEPGAGAAA